MNRFRKTSEVRNNQHELISRMASICQPTVLDSPLLEWTIVETMENWKRRLKPRNARVKRCLSELELLNQSSPIPDELSYFVQNLQCLAFTCSDFEIPAPILEELEMYLTIMTPIISNKVGRATWGKPFSNSIHKSLNKLRDHQYYPVLKKLYYWKIFYENLVIASSRPNSHTKHGKPPEFTVLQFDINDDHVWSSTSETGLNIDVTRSFTHIYQGNSHWLATRDHLLLLSDSAAQRFNCMFSCILGEIFKDNSLPSPHMLIKIFEWGDTILENLGNEGYRAIKFWEPLTVAELINFDHDEHVDTLKFKEMVRNDFLGSVPSSRVFLGIMLNRFDEIVEQSRDKGQKEALSQNFGLYRMWGHPTMNGTLGVTKLKEITQQNRALNHSSILHATCKWREHLTFSYYQKYGHLPTMKDYVGESYIVTCLKKGELPSLSHPQYKLRDWVNFTFDKNFVIPEKFDFSDLIADKATSLDFDQLKFRCQKFGDIGPGADRSVIIRWLQEEFISPLDFLERISREGFPPGERVIGVYPKEREGKNEPRLFGLMTLYKRLYIVLTEALLADFILPLFPEITMTFDSVTLLNRIYGCTKRLNPIKVDELSGVNIVTNLDFMKWNSYMREEETHAIFKDFDDLFGLTNVFTRSHELFNTSWLYLADGSITPKFSGQNLVEEPGVWTNHKGGIEGLRQKGWTIFTVVLLKMVSDMMGVKCQLLGQGDNQVLINTYYPRPGVTIREQHQEFMASLDSFLETIGPPLKTEESWGSSKFFIYGKCPLYEGNPLPMSLKKTCRIHRLNNDGLINLDGTLSSIAANASAAVSMSNYPIIPYALAVFESLGAIDLFLSRPFYGDSLFNSFKSTIDLRVPVGGISMKVQEKITPFLKDLMKPSNRHLLIQVLSIIPSALGGYPVIQWSDLIMRGFPDPVTASIWELKLLLNGDISPLLKEAIRRILDPELNHEVNPELLCSDPTSLNLLRGSRPKDKVKRQVLDFLVAMPSIKNEEFKDFLRLATGDQAPLSKCLFETEPCHPRVMSEIYNSTIQGRAMHCIRKVDKTPVLLNLMCKNNDQLRSMLRQEDLDNFGNEENVIVRAPRVIGSVFYSFERNQLAGVLMSLLHPNNLTDEEMRCSCQLAALLRRRSWGKDLHGVNVCFPLELLKEGNLFERAEGGQILISTVGESLNYESLGHSLGPFSPYLGSSSREKVEYQGKKLIVVAPSFITNAIRALRFINWGVQEDSLLNQLIYAIFHQFTDADPSSLIPKIGTVTGTLEHRVADMRTSHSGTLSIPYTVSTHVTVNTNQFKPGLLPHVSQFNNFNINFQAIFSTIAGEMVMRLSHDQSIPQKRKLIINCRDCIFGVNEDTLEISDETFLHSALESECLNTRSEFMWIPREHLDQLRDHGIVHPNNDGLAEMVRVTPISAQNILNEERNVLILSLIEMIMTQHPVIETQGAHWIYDESRYILPVAMVPSVDVTKFFDYLAFCFLIKTLYIRAKFWSQMSYKRIPFMILKERTTLAVTFPKDWLKPLISLFLFDDIYKSLVEDFRGVPPPKGSPPSEHEKLNCIHGMILCAFGKRLSTTQMSVIGKEILELNLPVSKLMCFHPQIIASLCDLIDTNDSTYENPILVSLAKIRDYERMVGGLSNDIDLLPLSSTKIPQKSPLSYGDKLTKSNLEKFPRTVLVSSDWLSKKIGESKLIPDVMPEGRKVGEPISLMALDDATFEVVIRTQNAPTHRKVILPLETVEGFSSPINSLYKFPVLVTSAPFKLLSIFQRLNMHYPSFMTEVERIFCSGDGTGGFSALLGHLFPHSIVFYNTYYDLSKLSSVGIDRYVPAAMVISGIDSSRIMGIEQMEEGISDLEDRDIVEQTLNASDEKLDLLVCDAEGSGQEKIWKPLNILSNLCAIASRSGASAILIKTYLSRLDVVIGQIILMKEIYETVHIIRSFFSGFGNTEVYLFGIGRRSRSSAGGIHMNVEMFDGVERLFISGTIPVDKEIRSWIKKLKSKLDIHVNCGQVSHSYNMVLENRFGSFIDASLEIFLQSVTNKDQEIRLYPDVMDVLRSMYLPIKFSDNRGTKIKLYLNAKNTREITKLLLMLVISGMPDDIIFYLDSVFSVGNLMIYENQKSSWTIALRENPQAAFNFKSWNLKDIWGEAKNSKMILAMVRQTRRYLSENGIKLITQTIVTEHTIQTVFPIDGKFAFKNIGDYSIPISELPALASGRVYFEPSQYSREEILGLVPNAINIMAQDLNEHPHLIQKVPFSEVILNKWRIQDRSSRIKEISISLRRKLIFAAREETRRNKR